MGPSENSVATTCAPINKTENLINAINNFESTIIHIDNLINRIENSPSPGDCRTEPSNDVSLSVVLSLYPDKINDLSTLLHSKLDYLESLLY